MISSQFIPNEPGTFFIAMSHTNEPTVNASMRTLEKAVAKSGIEPIATSLIVGKRSFAASINEAFDQGMLHGANYVIHTASDVFLMEDSLRTLIRGIKLKDNYVSIARGYDTIFQSSSGGLWIFDMSIVADNYRFADVYKGDLDFANRIESDTGLNRYYSEEMITYHHPIWTPFELFAKYRYSYPKYEKIKFKKSMLAFLAKGLEANPENSTLVAGIRGLEFGIKLTPTKSKNNEEIFEEFISNCSDLRLKGDEFYALHKPFQSLAQGILDSSLTNVTEPWPKGLSVPVWR